MTATAHFELSDKVALITGAAGGIGLATARLFAEAGAALALSDQPHACAVLAAEFAGANVVIIPADLADPASIRALCATALGWRGGVDVLVCNAGIHGPWGAFRQASEVSVDQAMTINLRSAMTICGEIAPAMAAKQGGSIVLTASIAGLRGNRAIGVYGITKAGIAQLARNIAVEWGPANVRANAVSPGLIRTAFAAPMLQDETIIERRLGLTPLRRVGEPEEIAATILFLASDASSFITGHNLVADGGTTISDGN